VAAGYAPGPQVNIALDAAAIGLDITDRQVYEVEVGAFKTGDEMVDYYDALITNHPAIVSIEDGLNEKDYPRWIKLNERIGGRVQLVAMRDGWTCFSFCQYFFKA
jgi:enolase